MGLYTRKGVGIFRSSVRKTVRNEQIVSENNTLEQAYDIYLNLP